MDVLATTWDCRNCGQPYKPWFIDDDVPSLFCTNECLEALLAKNRRIVPSPTTCPYCEQTFTPLPPTPHPFCSDACHFTHDLEARLLATTNAAPVTRPRNEAATPSRIWAPELDVSNPASAADWLRDNIGTGRLAGMFVRGPEIVHTPREGEDGYIPLSDNADDSDGPAQVRVATRDYIAARVQYTYGCFRLVKRGEDYFPEPTLFPATAARVVTNAVDMLPNLRRLRGVIHTPVFRPDGSLINAPGYDHDTRLLYLPEPGLTIPPVAPLPTPQQVTNAVRLVGEMLSGFPFTSEHDRANYIGALITPLLRAIAPPPYKLVAIGAHQPGSGKTKLANLARIIHGGVFRSETPEDDAELRKQVTSILSHTTGPVVVFDNVSGVLRSSTFAGLLTSGEWGDRPLGATAWVGVPNDRLWLITGNNLNLGADLPRRTLSSNIDPGMPRPELRTDFAIGDPEVWAKARRGQLLGALLTIAQAWVAAGMALPSERASDGYARWVRVVEGILANAGVPGTFDHASTQLASTVSADEDEWAGFLAAVHRVHGDQPWLVRDVLAEINSGSLLVPGLISLDALPADLAETAARHPHGPLGLTKKLGAWLRNRDGRWAGNLVARSAGTNRDGVKSWRIDTYPDRPAT